MHLACFQPSDDPTPGRRRLGRHPLSRQLIDLEVAFARSFVVAREAVPL
jgi:hypothetical protein